MTEILLGSIALEPNRWSLVDPDRRATITLSEWLDPAADAGFDGVELWEPHLREADDAEVAAVLGHRLPVRVFNTYVGFDDPDDTDRDEAAAWIRRSGAPMAKWNTGPERDPAALTAYGERLARWAATLPGVTLACECHDGSAMDDPSAAALVLAAGGPPETVRAMLHTNDGAERIREKFAAYGDRITHVHVNHLDRGAPPLTEIRDELAATVSLLGELGFAGSYTIEFVHGLGTDDDRPERLLRQAAADLAVLRELVG